MSIFGVLELKYFAHLKFLKNMKFFESNQGFFLNDGYHLWLCLINIMKLSPGCLIAYSIHQTARSNGLSIWNILSHKKVVVSSCFFYLDLAQTFARPFFILGPMIHFPFPFLSFSVTGRTLSSVSFNSLPQQKTKDRHGYVTTA